MARTATPSPAPRPLVVIGMLGPTLDAGRGSARWERWRPTVSIGQHDDLLVDRFELIHDPKHLALARSNEADFGQVSPETEVRRHEVPIADPWDFEEVYGALHDFARAYRFEPEREDYLIHITTGTHVAQICLFLLTESRHFPGRLLQTSPAGRRKDPAGTWRTIDLDLSRYDRLAARFEREHEDVVTSLKSGIETRSPSFNALIDRIELVAARSSDPMLITGPTGAGKSSLASRIFDVRRARHLVTGDLVEVNCATLRGDTAMSTLFGHRKGAFTGATTDRPGLLRAADRGMLFLDEIGELGLDEQAMLLRALEEKRFLPVGADTEVSSDFQLVAGTNRDLRDAVAAGSFREDLLARIDLWTFVLPGLRERAEDIEPNLDYELDRFAAARGSLVRFNVDARRRFLAFATGEDATWPGNFRDLNGSLVRMGTLAAGGRITTEVVDEEIERLRSAWGASRGTAGRSHEESDDAVLASVLDEPAIDAIDLFDRIQLAGVIRACRECRTASAAGRRLFAASRARRTSVNDADRLRKYLARFDLDWRTVASD